MERQSLSNWDSRVSNDCTFVFDTSYRNAAALVDHQRFAAGAKTYIQSLPREGLAVCVCVCVQCNTEFGFALICDCDSVRGSTD